MSTDKALRTPATSEEEMLRLTYLMRDSLMQRYDYPEQLATEISAVIVETLRREHGGERVYIHAPDNGVRDAAIRAEARTGNAAEVARRHGISERRVYQIWSRRS